MWTVPKEQVKNTFFRDCIELYEDIIVTSSLGQETTQPTLAGQYLCNIQDNAISAVPKVSGMVRPRTLRISIDKALPLNNDATYKIKVVDSRIDIDKTIFWTIDTVVEGQISKVLVVSGGNVV